MLPITLIVFYDYLVESYRKVNEDEYECDLGYYKEKEIVG